MMFAISVPWSYFYRNSLSLYDYCGNEDLVVSRGGKSVFIRSCKLHPHVCVSVHYGAEQSVQVRASHLTWHSADTDDSKRRGGTAHLKICSPFLTTLRSETNTQVWCTRSKFTSRWTLARRLYTEQLKEPLITNIWVVTYSFQSQNLIPLFQVSTSCVVRLSCIDCLSSFREACNSWVDRCQCTECSIAPWLCK